MMYSEAWQDEFVDLLLDSPQTGYFVDVGAGYDEEADGVINSNSLMFEQRGWDGIAVDCDAHRMRTRKCKTHVAFIGNGQNNTMLLADVLNQHESPKLIDYLSLDIEGPEYVGLVSVLGMGYEFKIITVEHNLYACNPGVAENKQNIFNLLNLFGYIRVIDNAGHRAIKGNLHNGYPYEDWYINPKYVSYQDVLKKLSN